MGWYGDRVTGHRLARASLILLGCLLLANCSSTSKLTSRVDPRYGVSASPRVVEPGQPVPKGGGVYRVGKPYMVGGREYVPEENRHYRAEGLASWYGDDFHGRLTANGEVYDMDAISAAHPTMPMPSYARVTNLASGKSLIVRVNDRGPYHANREIDVSSKAAELLGFKGHGVARVRVEYVGPAPIEGTDDRMLMATLRQGTPAPAPPSVMIASNRFLPNFARPPSAIPSGVPMPQDRPYDLGQGDGRYAGYQAQPRSETPVRTADADSRLLAQQALARHGNDPRLVDVSPDTDMPAYMARPQRPPPTRARDIAELEQRPPLRGAAMPSQWTPQPPPTSPVTAYAPVSDVSRAIATGCGLY